MADAPGRDRALARHVGEVLAEARAGRSRKALADSLGWRDGDPSLQRVERGEANPTLDRLQVIAAAYGGHLEVCFVADDPRDDC